MHSAMEQAKYWMWTRRKFPARPLFESSTPLPIPAAAAASPASAFYNESWEERAFAEDSAGLLGGCVWPPRSYSCSFCGREFRSAQALGGHMNVHRRDRARLKQSSMLGEEDLQDNLRRLSALPNAKPNPKPNPNSSLGFLFCPPPRQVVDDVSYSATHSLLKGFTGVRLWGEELRVGSKRGLSEEYEQQSCSYKRKKMNPITLYSEEHELKDFQEAEVINLSPETVEELDLELRLGDLPQV